MPWQETYVERFYRQRAGWADGTTEFHDLCASNIPCGADILEIGAGPSNATSRFLASLGKLQGVDTDPEVKTNDALDVAHVLTSDEYPFPANKFDACVSNYVLEHISNPGLHLQEISRVLKTNGLYLFRTPNLFHYVAMISCLTPHWVHKLFANRLRSLSFDSHEPYPTVYRLNSPARIRRLAAQYGFSVDRLRLVEKEPAYGMSSRFLFLIFMSYERLVNAFEVLANLRANLFVVLRKQD
jgi:SAM-dependent methyltransferase